MLVDCLMQVYRIGFLVTSLPVNCNSIYFTGFYLGNKFLRIPARLLKLLKKHHPDIL